MTTIDTEALRALADGATEGPWTRPTRGSSIYSHDGEDLVAGTWECEDSIDDPAPDAAFIAAARTAVPALLDALAEREGEVEHQRKILAKRLDIVRDLTAAHDGVVRDLMAIHRIAAEQRSRADDAEAEVRRLRTAYAEYDSAITWDTTCLNCASLLDRNYTDYCRADAAEAEIARLTSGAAWFAEQGVTQAFPQDDFPCCSTGGDCSVGAE